MGLDKTCLWCRCLKEVLLEPMLRFFLSKPMSPTPLFECPDPDETQRLYAEVYTVSVSQGTMLDDMTQPAP